MKKIKIPKNRIRKLKTFSLGKKSFELLSLNSQNKKVVSTVKKSRTEDPSQIFMPHLYFMRDFLTVLTNFLCREFKVNSKLTLKEFHKSKKQE